MKSHILVCFHVLMLLWVFGGCDPAESSLENPEGTEDASEESGLPDRFSLSGELEGGGSPEIEGGEEESSGEEGGDSNSNPTGGGDLPDNPDNGEACSPFCVGVVCGDDGCGGSCGSCPGGEVCEDGACVACYPECFAKQCGPDGCGGSCGTCPEGYACNDSGKCGSCTPSCAGKQCGDDGCGGSCGNCPGGQSCIDGLCEVVQGCTPNCAGKTCGPDGCGGACGTCPAGTMCSGGQCSNGSGCTPNCIGKTCGADGCGGTCGDCAAGSSCVGGQCEADPQCIPNCFGKNCGEDGCGSVCGECWEGTQCVEGNCMCVPDCAGKTCGEDGCGGSCGSCAAPDECSAGECVCTPDCSEDPCGEDGCGGLCGLCGCDNQKVFVTGMTTKAAGYWQVFYTTEDYPKFTEDKSKLVYINVSNQYETLEFDMGSKFTFEGVITGLRIDPPDGTKPFGIDSICLGVSEDNCEYKWDFEGATTVPKTFFGWTLHDIEDTWTDGEKWGGASINGDPHFNYPLEFACDE